MGDLPPLAIALWGANIVLDTTGQLAFKAAAAGGGESGWRAHWAGMVRRPWIWLGVASYVAECLLWLAFLSLVPLSTGLLLASINIVVIMVAGRAVFAEKLSPLRVTGILLIAGGVAIVGLH